MTALGYSNFVEIILPTGARRVESRRVAPALLKRTSTKSKGEYRVDIQRNSKSMHATLRSPIGVALCLTALLGCHACVKSGQEEAYSPRHIDAPGFPNDRAPLPSEIPPPPGAVRVTLMNMRIDMPSYLPAGETTFSI